MEKKSSVGIPFVIATILIALSLVAIILLVVYWNRENVTEIQGRFGIVFDAGGSGTRMHIYEYLQDSGMREVSKVKCEKQGIAKYGTRNTQLASKLNDCLEQAKQQLPLTVIKSAPIYFAATGGMRILKLKNETVYANIWQLVQDVLKNGSFPVKMARTLKGKEEGGYSWSSINTLLGHHEKQSGLFEVGSSSFQISFEPHSSNTNVPNQHHHTVILNELKYDVYAHSYLCFGKSEFVNRYKAMIIKNSSYSPVVMDPCSYKGFNETVQSTDIWSSPCVMSKYANDVLGESIGSPKGSKTFTLIGTGDFTKCYTGVKEMFNERNCTDNCSVNGIYQPTTSGLFTAIGGGVYYPSIFLNIDKPTTLENYRNATEHLCGKTFQEVQKMKGYNKYARDYCLSDVYNYFLFNNVLKLGNRGEISFQDKINNRDVSWTLGLMLTHVKDMSQAIIKKTKELADKYFYPFIVISTIVLIIGILFLLIKCFSRSKSRKHGVNGTV